MNRLDGTTSSPRSSLEELQKLQARIITDIKELLDRLVTGLGKELLIWELIIEFNPDNTVRPFPNGVFIEGHDVRFEYNTRLMVDRYNVKAVIS